MFTVSQNSLYRGSLYRGLSVCIIGPSKKLKLPYLKEVPISWSCSNHCHTCSSSSSTPKEFNMMRNKVISISRIIQCGLLCPVLKFSCLIYQQNSEKILAKHLQNIVAVTQQLQVRLMTMKKSVLV